MIERDIETADGQTIGARFFFPERRPRGSVLVAPAMGVSQAYYAPFATWLAARGFLAVTFDYRGVGRSRRGSLRGFSATITDWARLDCAAMIEAVVRQNPGAPLYWIGHSLGGQIVPLVPNRERVTKVVTVATGSGYWLENASPLRHTVWWLWLVVVPLSVRLFGYFPGKRLRKVGDLPRGVMEQWRRWCLNKEYAVGAEGEHVRTLYASLKTPILSLSFTDDEFMSARNIESMNSFFKHSPLRAKRISPQEVGSHRIGHFGFFKAKFEGSLWTAQLLPELVSV